MSKVNFSEIAKDYEKIASMQKSASEIMLNLLKIKENDDVLGFGLRNWPFNEESKEPHKGKGCWHRPI